MTAFFYFTHLIFSYYFFIESSWLPCKIGLKPTSLKSLNHKWKKTTHLKFLTALITATFDLITFLQLDLKILVFGEVTDQKVLKNDLNHLNC